MILLNVPWGTTRVGFVVRDACVLVHMLVCFLAVQPILSSVFSCTVLSISVMGCVLVNYSNLWSFVVNRRTYECQDGRIFEYMSLDENFWWCGWLGAGSSALVGLGDPPWLCEGWRVWRSSCEKTGFPTLVCSWFQLHSTPDCSYLWPSWQLYVGPYPAFLYGVYDVGPILHSSIRG